MLDLQALRALAAVLREGSFERAARQIRRFGELGVKVALDDFGSGFSSLTYLHALPVDIVKLDRSLASGSNPARDQTLYRSVIKLCDDLGLDVIAEGVETVEQADMVSRAGGRLAAFFARQPQLKTG